MYAITGITGNVGGALARTLLAAGLPVRAVVRDARKAQAWAARGCSVAVADMDDADALAQAFTDATAVFVLPPPAFDPAPGFPAARRTIAAVHEALQRARPGRVLCLSTVGAQATQENLLSQRGLMEQALAALDLPLTLLRPAWFMDNFGWDVAAARDTGVIDSFLQPLDRALPMVAAADVGRVAAELLQQPWQGRRVVELEGALRYSPRQVAETFAWLLQTPVQAQAVPREDWERRFLAQGMQHPQPRMRMLDGFNEGWIRFEGAPATILRGNTSLQSVLGRLLERPE